MGVGLGHAGQLLLDRVPRELGSRLSRVRVRVRGRGRGRVRVMVRVRFKEGAMGVVRRLRLLQEPNPNPDLGPLLSANPNPRATFERAA